MPDTKPTVVRHNVLNCNDADLRVLTEAHSCGDMLLMTQTPLAAERQRQAITQEGLALLSGVSVRTIQRAESGENVGLSTLRLLAAGLGVPVSSITEVSAVEESMSPDVYVYVEQQVRQFQKRKAWRLFDYIFGVLLFFVLLFIDVLIFSGGRMFFVFLVLSLVASFVATMVCRLYAVEPYLDRRYPLTKIEERSKSDIGSSGESSTDAD